MIIDVMHQYLFYNTYIDITRFLSESRDTPNLDNILLRKVLVLFNRYLSRFT